MKRIGIKSGALPRNRQVLYCCHMKKNDLFICHLFVESTHFSFFVLVPIPQPSSSPIIRGFRRGEESKERSGDCQGSMEIGRSTSHGF